MTLAYGARMFLTRGSGFRVQDLQATSEVEFGSLNPSAFLWLRPLAALGIWVAGFARIQPPAANG